jgi:hypothetical protein
MMCRVNLKKLHDSGGDVNIVDGPRRRGKVAARCPTVSPCLGFILDNPFGNEYCFYPNGPGQPTTRLRGVAVDPSDKKK